MPAIVTAFQDTGHIDHPSRCRRRPRPVVKRVGVRGSRAHSRRGAAGAPFTVLLLGSDNDSKFGGTILTQSMILARVNPTTKQVVMESIPRDLWVPIATRRQRQDRRRVFARRRRVRRWQRSRRTSTSTSTTTRGSACSGLVNLINQVGGIDVVATNPGHGRLLSRRPVRQGPVRVRACVGAARTTAHERRARHSCTFARDTATCAATSGGRSASSRSCSHCERRRSCSASRTCPDIATAMANDFSTDMSISEIASLLPIASHVQLQNVQQVILASPYTSAPLNRLPGCAATELDAHPSRDA